MLKNFKIFKTILLSLSLIGLVACSKQEPNTLYLGGLEPILNFSTSVSGDSSAYDSIPLNINNETKEAVLFSWTNPNYQFTSGFNSQNVVYTLEFDTAGANFNGKYKKEVNFSGDLNKSYNSFDFNIILGDLKLKTNTVGAIEVRLRASINGNAFTNKYSTTYRLKVRPYAPPPKVPLPTDGTLWAIGNAFASGWDNAAGNSILVNDQKFTKVNDTKYELIINFVGGGGYKVIQTIGVWGTQYRSINGEFEYGTFDRKDADPQFGAPAAAGRYKITLDFQEGTYTVVPAN